MREVLIPGISRSVTDLCVGTSALGSNEGTYGFDVDEQRAVATVDAALSSPIRFLDTSNGYGASEERIGIALNRAGGLPADYVLATKADPVGDEFDEQRILDSFQESCTRLGVARFDLFHLHDPERYPFEYLTRPGGAIDGMRRLRDDGLIGAVGVAAGNADFIRRLMDLDLFTVVLHHNKFTLLNRDSEPLMNECAAAGVVFLNAAPFASGALAKPWNPDARYQYQRVTTPVREALQRLQKVCDEYAIPLPAVALRFSTRDQRVTSTVVGMSTPTRVAETVANHALDIPDEIWPLLDDAARIHG